jgi:hypothetical protein
MNCAGFMVVELEEHGILFTIIRQPRTTSKYYFYCRQMSVMNLAKFAIQKIKPIMNSVTHSQDRKDECLTTSLPG